MVETVYIFVWLGYDTTIETTDGDVDHVLQLQQGSLLAHWEGRRTSRDLRQEPHPLRRSDTRRQRKIPCGQGSRSQDRRRQSLDLDDRWIHASRPLRRGS